MTDQFVALQSYYIIKLQSNTNARATLMTSRNNIFSQDHSIQKPAEIMNETELTELKAGHRPSLSLVIPNKDSVKQISSDSSTYPISEGRTAYVSEQPYSVLNEDFFKPPDETSKQVRRWIDLDDPLKSESFYLNSSNSDVATPAFFSNDSLEQSLSSMSLQNVSIPTTNESEDVLQLSYLPTRRNLLGYGQYAQVFRGEYTLVSAPSNARKTDELKPCAVKRVKWCYDARTSAYAEVFFLQRLKHDNIVRLLGVKEEIEKVFRNEGESETQNAPHGRLLVILEFMNGTVWDFIKKRGKEVGRELFKKWATHLSSAVAYLHEQGIIHHDIKPHNLLVLLDCLFRSTAHSF